VLLAYCDVGQFRLRRLVKMAEVEKLQQAIIFCAKVWEGKRLGRSFLEGLGPNSDWSTTTHLQPSVTCRFGRVCCQEVGLAANQRRRQLSSKKLRWQE
jgi:hypothetical protein